MSLAELSSLAIVTAAVVYLMAFIAHAAEWAAVRGVALKASDPDADAATEVADRARLRSDSFGRMGVALTVIAAAAHLFGVLTRGLAAHRMPWGNMYEFVISALAFVIVTYLIGVWKWGLRWLGAPVSLLLAIGTGAAATIFYVAVAPLVPALHSVWFIIHIVAACISAAAFNVGGLASILYLVKLRAVRLAREREADRPEPDAGASAAEGPSGSGGVALATRRRSKLADPQLTGFLARVPSLQAIDTFAYRAMAFGFPIWTFTIAAGSIWAEYAWGRYWGWDPKETWSLVTWVVYACYLHARATAGWKGRNAAIIAIIGLVTFWFNFVGVNLFINGLHSYAGI